ncbi:DUF2970 domain-containing protein [Paucimonas lemoignei]|uniref:DUF2970 domain-containing protein n=1 Tax=Paucimonas lemoignei TaxID=29443 RepID=UPI001044A4B3|nr:DUF2970 domain-containing protein [Paucimonas lemoignei]
MKLLQIIRMVLWSFFGVRKRAGLESDIRNIHPLAVIGVAIMMVGLFIGLLIAIVHAVINGLM